MTTCTCLRCGAPAREGAWTVRYSIPRAAPKLAEYCDDCGPRIPANQTAK